MFAGNGFEIALRQRQILLETRDDAEPQRLPRLAAQRFAVHGIPRSEMSSPAVVTSRQTGESAPEKTFEGDFGTAGMASGKFTNIFAPRRRQPECGIYLGKKARRGLADIVYGGEPQCGRKDQFAPGEACPQTAKFQNDPAGRSEVGVQIAALFHASDAAAPDGSGFGKALIHAHRRDCGGFPRLGYFTEIQ